MNLSRSQNKVPATNLKKVAEHCRQRVSTHSKGGTQDRAASCVLYIQREAELLRWTKQLARTGTETAPGPRSDLGRTGTVELALRSGGSVRSLSITTRGERPQRATAEASAGMTMGDTTLANRGQERLAERDEEQKCDLSGRPMSLPDGFLQLKLSLVRALQKVLLLQVPVGTQGRRVSGSGLPTCSTRRGAKTTPDTYAIVDKLSNQQTAHMET